jgi:hypothetical protein
VHGTIPREIRKRLPARKALCFIDKAFWILLFSGLSFQSAAAKPRAFKIHLEIIRASSAEGCPSDAEMRGGIVDRLGYDPFYPLDDADRVLTASFSSSTEGIATTLSLSTRDGRALGEQRLAFGISSCVEAAAALELAIAMAVDPPSLIDSGFARPAEPPPAPLPASKSAPSPLPSPPRGERGFLAEPSLRADELPSAGVPAPRVPGPTIEASIGAVVPYAAGPHVTAGATAAIGLRWRRTSVDLELRADLPTGIPASGGSVRSALIFGTLAPCLRSRSVGGCLLLGLGADQASGQGLAPSLHRASPYAALGARAFTDLPLTRALRLQPRVEAWAPTTRTTLIAAEQTVWTTPPLSLAVGIALVIDLGGAPGVG